MRRLSLSQFGSIVNIPNDLPLHIDIGSIFVARELFEKNVSCNILFKTLKKRQERGDR
jgi:hypothetical protein